MILAKVFQCLAHTERLRILHALFEEPRCVQEIQTMLGLSQVEVSKHLAVLKLHGLVEVRKDRNWRIYAIAQNASATIQRQLKCLEECLSDREPMPQVHARKPGAGVLKRAKPADALTEPSANDSTKLGIEPLEDHLL